MHWAKPHSLYNNTLRRLGGGVGAEKGERRGNLLFLCLGCRTSVPERVVRPDEQHKGPCCAYAIGRWQESRRAGFLSQRVEFFPHVILEAIGLHHLVPSSISPSHMF